MKKIISLILSVVMLLSITTAVTANAEEFPMSGKCGDNITWKFDASTSTMYITGTGEMYDYTYDPEPSYSYLHYNNGKYTAKKLVVSDGITHIGNSVFSGMDFEDITLGKDIKVIKKYAFSALFLLKTIVLPESLEIIEEYAFDDCGKLESVTFGNQLKEVKFGAFNNCYSLKNITLLSSVTKIEKYALGYEVYWGDYNDYNQKPKSDFILTAEYGSAAQKYAFKYGVNYNDAKGCETHTFGKQKAAIKKICTKQRGMYYKQCTVCNSRRYTFKNSDHEFKKGSTKVVRKATYFKCGIKTKYCTFCKKRIKFKVYKKINHGFVDSKVYKNKIRCTFKNAYKPVTHYEVQIQKSKPGVDFDVIKKVVATKDEKIVIDGLKKNTSYDIRYRSLYKKGNKTARSIWIYDTIKTKK